VVLREPERRRAAGGSLATGESRGWAAPSARQHNLPPVNCERPKRTSAFLSSPLVGECFRLTGHGERDPKHQDPRRSSARVSGSVAIRRSSLSLSPASGEDQAGVEGVRAWPLNLMHSPASGEDSCDWMPRSIPRRQAHDADGQRRRRASITFRPPIASHGEPPTFEGAYRLRRACSVGRRFCTTSKKPRRTRPRRAGGGLI
jgi:hypothetical protein